MNINHILEMGGYGMYVWPAYFITFSVFIGNVWVILREKNRTKKLLQNYFAEFKSSK